MSYPSNLTFLSSKPNQLKQDSYFDSHDVGVEKKGGVQGYVFTFETLHYSWLLFSIKFCPPVLITKRLKKKKVKYRFSCHQFRAILSIKFDLPRNSHVAILTLNT